MQFPGLSHQEVAERVANGQRNFAVMHATRSYPQIIFSNVVNLYSITLAAALVTLFFLGGSKDAVFAALLLFFSITMNLFQELRAKWQLDHLAALQKHIATVRRDGKIQHIDSQHIVQDDVIILKPGDPIYVDGPVLESDNLEIDESSLTGESEYVYKQVGDALFSGSFCAAGTGIMKVAQLGKESTVGKLQQEAKVFATHLTPVEQWLSMTFRVLMVVIVVLGPLTYVAGTTQGLATTDILENIINLVSSLVPQGLIVSVMISFAYGALRMSRWQTLVQRLNAVESMGHTTVLCVDKTGTLTLNHLQLGDIVPLGNLSRTEVEKSLHTFLKHQATQNATTIAILSKFSGSSDVSAEKTAEVPFTSARKWSGITFAKNKTFLLGAPELFLKGSQLAQATQLGQEGLRVVVFASASEALRNGQVVPPSAKPIALVTLRDELRPGIVETLHAFATQHIGIKIISGDSAETVLAIAGQAGVSQRTLIVEAELQKLKQGDFDKAVLETTLFARITPTMKRQILRSLNKQGFYTAMVGDGVNDVLALKSADVAIAMNDGAQITKDVADIVLLNNAFSVLPKALQEGRDITQRLYAVAKIFFIKVIYLSVFFILIGFTGLDFPLSLRQSTWIAFITVGLPTLFISFHLLTPKPSRSFAKDVVQYSVFAGLFAGLAMTIIPVLISQLSTDDITTSRTVVTLFACFFGTYILLDIHGIRLSLRSLTKHWFATILILCTAIIGVMVPMMYPLTFDFFPLDIAHWLLTVVLTFAAILFFSYALRRFDLHHVLEVLSGNATGKKKNVLEG